MKLPVEVEKYISKYSNKKWRVESAGSGIYKNIIVIPVIAEYENIKTLLGSITSSDNKYFSESLFLFVVNNTESSENEVKANNRDTILLLRDLIQSKSDNYLMTEIKDSGLNIGLIDCSSHGLALDDKYGGVGLARKTGMDIALKLFDYPGEGKNLIICLDADCKVAGNYLTAIVEECDKNDYEAGFVQFEHTLPEEGEEADAIICYEIFLRYYVLGLLYSESPYAYHTVGSTIVCTHEAYIRAQGMNKRKAGEDFYFMQKLAKLYPINKISSAVVYPSGRTSWRVPFGTGQRVNRFLSKTHDEYSLYAPEIFELLKSWHKLFYANRSSDPEFLLTAAGELNTGLQQFLTENDFEKSFRKILDNSKSSEQLSVQKRQWFDAFRTMKLIHYLRDNLYPNINMFDAVDDMLLKMGTENIPPRDGSKLPDRNEQIQYLAILRRLT
ncbi:MAG: hypothetical protein JW995_08575 [Melioribacteraceae bacterium]|nr:hypothetical protein [Melioribacteraceae bacterium]